MRADVDDVLRVQPAPSNEDQSHRKELGHEAITQTITLTLALSGTLQLSLFGIGPCPETTMSVVWVRGRERIRGREGKGILHELDGEFLISLQHGQPVSGGGERGAANVNEAGGKETGEG